MDRKYNIFALSVILQNRESTLQWLRDEELIPSERFCSKHKKNMTLTESAFTCGQFVCEKKGKYCHRHTVAENTWFEQCHNSAASCMMVTYCFSVSFDFQQTIRESSIVEGQNISSETIADRFSFCREVCMIALDEHFLEEGQIGGVGEIVEIDECKIGRRKFERGQVVEGSWILGMIHRGHSFNYRLEICPDNKRDKTTLINLIKKHVVVGTEIHTDCWKGYIDLEQCGYVHDTVKHSEEFVNSTTGAHTQNIESSWRWMRRSLSRGGVRKHNLADHLFFSVPRFEGQKGKSGKGTLPAEIVRPLTS
ncbi:uncharacterized protein LOC122508906 [Leptopilina heterotoma]|uniref:uncharacterized protein LOC122508906 n=1 Tax=Leptopilina heterotoma TaxID=63436 RepID=UPI001CA9D89D|nr:uncharacterized protein LOC122508906 [Leptopilina heterotoma]